MQGSFPVELRVHHFLGVGLSRSILMPSTDIERRPAETTACAGRGLSLVRSALVE
jgi:hypothetical protein